MSQWLQNRAFVTALPVLLALEHGIRDPQVSPLDVAGLSLWAAGYALEVAADYQKTQFRRDQSKKGQFIQSGLWYYSRHPNYCGEIMMWIGVFCTSVHTLPSTALKCWAAVSPAFRGVPALVRVGRSAAGAAGRRALGIDQSVPRVQGTDLRAGAHAQAQSESGVG
ncbi:hypothetical protein ON010_g8542 [Phytophthora cinnamomi]|nr:hypothetical protein ON010_g8542 [Phytophthora cinnamomi]